METLLGMWRIGLSTGESLRRCRQDCEDLARAPARPYADVGSQRSSANPYALLSPLALGLSTLAAKPGALDGVDAWCRVGPCL